jgi:omega-6 fatty acid desaturase (delta-12 desaturase)
MSTTAANPSLTTATQRSGADVKSAAAQKSAGGAEKKYARRQAKPYKQEDLVKFDVPDLTIKDLLSAIPAHCFERSALHSGAYVLRDLIFVSLNAYAASFIDPTLAKTNFNASPLTPLISAAWQHSLTRFTLWSAYAFLQGLFFTGLWVQAHECGHQAFSPSKTINNTVGWVLHSALLVPYHSWRISHARHHAATGHLTRDEVFVPRTREQRGRLPLQPASQEDAQDVAQVDRSLQSDGNTAPSKSSSQNVSVDDETWGEWFMELVEDAPLYNFIYILVQQLLGWPLYLLKNSSGQLHFPKGTNHFDPNSIIFNAHHRNQVLISDLGIAITLGSLATWAYFTSVGEVARYYLVPYLWCNHWLVMITYLQHTDPVVPHYKAESWNFVRGALCTVDRKWLGPIGPYLLHGIAETHVLHHVSSKIPHYHAWEATEALKKRLGQHYQMSNENVFVSLWKSISTCKFVDENDQVAFYRDIHGVPAACVAPGSGYNSDSGVALSE